MRGRRKGNISGKCWLAPWWPWNFQKVGGAKYPMVVRSAFLLPERSYTSGMENGLSCPRLVKTRVNTKLSCSFGLLTPDENVAYWLGLSTEIKWWFGLLSSV